jgi:hypothetical protein
MRDIRAQKARGMLGEPRVSCIFWRRLRGKGVFLANMISHVLWWTWENPSGMCHNNSANTFPGAVLKDKDGAVGV